MGSARQRSVLTLSCLRGAALRLSGKLWDRGLTAEERRAVAERDLADEEEARDAWASLAVVGGGVWGYGGSP